MVRLLVDVTDLEHRGSAHGGIQRVVYEVSRQLLSYSYPEMTVWLISFDKDQKQFYRSEYNPLTNGSEAINDSTELIDYSTRRKVKNILRRSMGWGNSIESDTITTPVTREWIEFHHTDNVLILGMAWENLDIQRVLTRERLKTHFTLTQIVYDLIIPLHPHLHHPANFAPYSEHMKGVIANSDTLLAISESTKQDTLKFATQHGITPPKIDVIRLGDKVLEKGSVTRKPDLSFNKEFILCVGTVEVRKNHSLLYYTYKLAASRGVELPQLIIVGGNGWYSGDVQYLITTDPEMKDTIKIMNGLSDQNLAWLYKNCLFTVYPSMYEGWGLPIAESLAFDKLCLSSHTSSMTEIAGDMIDYFSPYSTDECLEKIRYYMDPDHRKTRELTIEKNYHPTSWVQTGDAIRTSILEGQHDNT